MSDFNFVIYDSEVISGAAKAAQDANGYTGDLESYINGLINQQLSKSGGIFKGYAATPTAGQTLFTLPYIPVNPSALQVFVNGVHYKYGVHYMIDQALLTWYNLTFTLGTKDTLEVYDHGSS